VRDSDGHAAAHRAGPVITHDGEAGLHHHVDAAAW